MNNTGKVRRAALSLAALTLAGMTACQSGYRSYAKKLDAHIVAGEYAAASEMAIAKAEDKAKDEVNRVIYNLEAARAAQLAGDFEASREYFARVHEDVRPYLDEKAEAKITEGAATTLVNQATATFRGTPVDRIMATSLNAVNLIALGDLQEARVQLNLTRDWQEDAVRRFATEIRDAEEQLEKEAQEEGVEVDDERVGGILSEHYADLNDLSSYADFRNPFASHLRGVFLLNDAADFSDAERARFELRDVLSMEAGTEPMIAPDLQRIEQGNPDTPTTWVYIMAGRAAWLDELRLDIPIPVGNVNYVSAAFPRLKFHGDDVGVPVISSSAASTESVLLADIDSMVAAEFRSRLPQIITQEILSAALKAGITYGARESGGTIGQVIGITYQAASTSADTRNWRTLPKKIMLARVPTPADGQLVARTGEVETVINIEPGKSHCVILTMPSGLTPVCSIVQASFNPETPREMAVENE